MLDCVPPTNAAPLTYMLKQTLIDIKPFVDCRETDEYLLIVSEPHSGKGEVHHILPEVIYPEFAKEKWNLVNLSYQNHYRVHELLPYMVLGKHRGSMLYAWNLMRGRTGEKFVDASTYAELRNLHSVRVSQQMRENQPMHRPEVVAKFVGRKRPEHSVAMSGDNNPSKRDEFRGFMRENNPMKMEENREKFRGDKNHNYGVQVPAEKVELLRNIKTGVSLSEETKLKIAKALTGKSVTRVSVDGIVYSSVKNAASVLNVNRHTIARWISSGRAVKLDTQEKGVMIDNLVFSSISEASRILSISVGRIKSMLKHNLASYTTKD